MGLPRTIQLPLQPPVDLHQGGGFTVINSLRETNTWAEPDFHETSDLSGHSSDRFIDAFGGCCASLAVLLNTLASLEPPEPFDDSHHIVSRLCVVAGTVGYPACVEFASEGYRAPGSLELR
jgi:hypothetical protein